MPAGRRAASALAALLVLTVLLPGRAAAQRDSSLTEIGVQIHIERGPDSLLIGLVRADSVLLIPLREFLGLVEIRETGVVIRRRLEARLGDPPLSFGFITDEAKAFQGRVEFPIGPLEAVWRAEELYVSTSLLARALGVELALDWNDMLLHVAMTSELPVVQRLARERRRTVALLRYGGGEAPSDVGGRPALLDGLAADWAMTTATREPLDNSALQLGVGATLVGGALDVQTTTTRSPFGTRTETFWSWSIAWDEREWLRQVRLGDVTTGGPRGFPIQGGNVTNVPYLRSAEFASQQLFGRLPLGWEVEVYRGEQLIGYTPVDTSGHFGVGVPVVYGQNPVEQVAYGPHGEVRRYSQTFFIPFERLPSSRFEYNLGFGRCRTAQCNSGANLDLRYGVSDRVTVQGGADAFNRDSVPSLFHPYGLVNVAITRPLSVTGELVGHGFARGRVDFDPGPDLHLDAGYTRYDTTIALPLVGSTIVARQVAGAIFWRPGVLGGDLFFQADGVWQEGAMRTRTVARVSATSRLLGARASGQFRLELDRALAGGRQALGAFDAGADGVVTRGPVRNTLLRAALSLECRGPTLGGCRSQLSRWSTGVGRQLLGALRIDAGVHKDAGISGLTLDVQLAAAMPWMRATSRNSYQGAAGVTGSQLFEGSVLWNRRQGRVDFANGRNLGRAGVAGVVFFDSNGDGVQQADEPGLDQVSVRVGTDAVITDSLGRFRAWNLVPFVYATVEVDTLALANPLWYPTLTSVRLPPSPNAFRFVSVAVREGGEVNGRVEFEGRPLAGAKLMFTGGDGRRHEVTSFTDGAFYVMRLPAGRYSVEVDPTLLSEARATASEVSIVLRDGAMRVDDVVLRVQRRP